jgi:hypothetical protein
MQTINQLIIQTNLMSTLSLVAITILERSKHSYLSDYCNYTTQLLRSSNLIGQARTFLLQLHKSDC